MDTSKKKQMEEMYLGKEIRIIHLTDENTLYDNRVGIVEYVDDMGDLHGSWGGLAILPDVDRFELTGK